MNKQIYVQILSAKWNTYWYADKHIGDIYLVEHSDIHIDDWKLVNYSGYISKGDCKVVKVDVHPKELERE